MTPRCAPPQAAPTPSGKVFVLGVSGASGAPYAVRTLEQMLMSGATVHCVISEYGQRLLFDAAAAGEKRDRAEEKKDEAKPVAAAN